jgi:hypothetical protein
MKLYKAETYPGSAYGPLYVVADSYGAAERLILERNDPADTAITGMSTIKGRLIIQDDPGTDALIDELRNRIAELEEATE